MIFTPAQNVQGTRIQWIDMAKGYGIILVMLIHCYINPIYSFWFSSFFMGLFFFLSGYTFNVKTAYLPFLCKKVKGLLVPYLFIAVVTILCNGFFALLYGREYAVLTIIGKYLLQIRYTLLWFITALFTAEQILFFLHGLIKRKNSDYSWLLSAFFLMLFFAGYRYLIGVDLPWNADLALLGASFMCLGKWFSTTSFFDYAGKLQMTLQMILALSISVICSGLNWYFYCFVDWYHNQFGNPLLFIISAVAGIIFIVRLSELFSIQFIFWLGANTLCFYGFHRLIIDYSFGLYNKLGIIAPKGSAAEFALALTRVALSIVLLTPVCLLLLKYDPWCLGKARKHDACS